MVRARSKRPGVNGDNGAALSEAAATASANAYAGEWTDDIEAGKKKV